MSEFARSHNVELVGMAFLPASLLYEFRPVASRKAQPFAGAWDKNRPAELRLEPGRAPILQDGAGRITFMVEMERGSWVVPVAVYRWRAAPEAAPIA